jgi:cobaltochelatase CobS
MTPHASFAQVAKVKDLFDLPAPDTATIEVQVAGGATPEVDAFYRFREDLLRPVLMWLSGIGSCNLLLVGPLGTGKSSLVEQVCARLGREVYVVQCHGRAEPSYFVGQIVLGQPETGNGTVTRWVDGPLLTAMRAGAVAVLDEYDVLPPDTVAWLHRLRDSRTVLVPETGELITAHPDFRLALTGNTGGTGDSTGAYRGTKTQNAAFMDGLSVVAVQYMSEDDEFAVVSAKLGKRGTPALLNSVRCMLKVAGSVRSQFESGEIDVTISTRSLLRWAELTWAYDNVKTCKDPLLEGLNVALLNRTSQEDRAAIETLLNAAREIS